MSSTFSIYQKVLPGLQRLSVARSSSSLSSQLKVDPSSLVSGLTREQLDSDEAIAAYIKSNFPDALAHHEEEQQQVSKPIAEDEGETKKKIVTNEFPLNIRPLVTHLRDPASEEGSRNSHKLRKFEHMIPGLLYGGNPNLGIFSHQPESKVLIKTPLRNLQRELDRYHRTFESRVYDLTVLEDPDDESSGTVHRVTPQNLQKHPVHDTMFYCANFCRYHAGRPLKLPITYINEEESAALKRDGFIVPIQRYVECFVEEGVDIPEQIELECTGLEFKDVIRTDRLILPDGVRFSKRVLKRGDDFIVGVVFGKSRGALKKEEEES